jgi:UDP-4-amino-4,6-dideoxy-N-acetyl-beta-L-altrosamine transaminase
LIVANFSYLPYGRQSIDDDDVETVAEALRAEMLTTGPLVERFEAVFAQATDAIEAVACNSGTAALHLAAMASGIQAGEFAIVPTITFLATANVFRMCGAEVLFCDVDPDTGLMTAATLSKALGEAQRMGRRTRAVVPVHLNGRFCDMPAIADIAENNGLEVIEDACHALGASLAGACLHSSAACFSTHPVKAMTTAEGGIVTTRSAERARLMRRLRSHGMERDASAFQLRDIAFEHGLPNPWHYEMTAIGYNYRLPDVLCALGMSQLRKLGRLHERRCQIAAQYDTLLADLAPVVRPASLGAGLHGWHLYAVLIDYRAIGSTRKRVVDALREEGIGTQVHYIPVHRQPYYAERYGHVRLTGADAYFDRSLSIPFFPSMTDLDVARVAGALRRIVGLNT